MITLFTIPRAFTSEDKIRQENTLGAWTRLVPSPEIILFCDDPGVAEAAKRFGCTHIPDVECNERGIPYVSHAFRRVTQLATNDILCYANADIIFVQDLITAVETVRDNFHDEPFLIIGQRWNVPVPGPIEFTDGWQQRLQVQVRQHSGKVSTSAIDYFVYSRGAIVDLPDFLVGSPKWDNWLVKDAEKRGLQIISATEAITCIHQWHEHRWPAEGARYNHSLWWQSGAGVGYVYSGSWLLGPGTTLRKKPKSTHSESAWVAGTVRPVRVVPKPKFKHKPVPTTPKSVPTAVSIAPRAPRPVPTVPKDELGLPVNMNISTQELAGAAKKLPHQQPTRKPARKRGKHSHSGPSREAIEAEMARAQQIQDTIRAARIAARDARLAKRARERAG